MGIRLLIGTAKMDKAQKTMTEIQQKLCEDPQGPPIYWIVPDQMTFQLEYELFRNKVIQGSTRAHVISFSRLAFRLLQETGGVTKQFISSVGTQMMLRKIIEEKQYDFKMFQKAVEKQGFLGQLEKTITEFKRYQVTPAMLQEEIASIGKFVHQTPSEISLVKKLNDLFYIYEQLSISLQGKYMDNEDRLQLLAENIPESNLLNDAEIYMNGFHSFTPQELQVIEVLLGKCKNVTISLTTENPSEVPTSELDLFYETKETYRQLNKVAMGMDIDMEIDVLTEHIYDRFYNRPYFHHLDANFNVLPVPIYKEEAPIQIAEAVHPRAEVEGVAQEIVRLVREEDYRYRDIVILLRQMGHYHQLIETIFRDYDIPVFIDEKQTMLNHPLIELIRSGLDIVEGNFRYAPIFRVLKTGFIPVTDQKFPLTNDAIDELENYVLEYGIRTRTSWLGDKEWVYDRFHGFDQQIKTDEELKMQQKINSYRQQVVQAIEQFDQEVRSQKTIEGKCRAIYMWLERMGVPKKLEEMREQYDESGQTEKGREQEQVWDAIIQLFDEIVEIAGTEKMSLSNFKSTLDSGLETLEFAHVPPSIDHVIVGTIDRSRISEMKCAFLIGVNEGVWPMKPDSFGMMNEDERQLLAKHGIVLSENGKRQLLNDWFYMYLAFTSVRDKLWISFPLSDEEGKSKMPSQLINRMEEMFPSCSNHILWKDPDELYDAARFITTPVKTRAALTLQLARHKKGYPVKDIWFYVLNWYMNHQSKDGTTYHILQSLYYQNRPVSLTQETTEALYPKTVKASVSRLEMYHRCSYQHFAKYTLGLKERKIYKLDAPDIGQLFHEALKKITEWVQHNGKGFATVDKKDAANLANKAVTSLAPILQHQILRSSNRYQYIQRKLQEVIARATYVLGEQARQSEFTPIGLELGFGEHEKLDPVTLELPNGFRLMLRGRIDRVDQSRQEQALFLRIIDYKSSDKALNMVEVYYGLALQMLAYLDVVLSQSEEWLGIGATPAGVLYFHVHNPMISSQTILTDEEIDQALLKKYKMQGLLLSDENALRLMDTSLDAGKRSEIIPAGLKKNGGFYSGSQIASAGTLQLLRNHIHGLMYGAGVDITAGGIDLNPYQHKQRIACTYCPFLSVCQFDPTLEENNYHKLTDMKDDVVMEKLLEKKGEHNG